MKLKATISGITNMLIWAAAIILLLSLICVHINPSVISLAGLLTLIIPGLILLNLLVLIYALIRSKTAGWITFIALLLSIPQIGNLWGFDFLGKEAPDNSFSLMTYNVRNFDLYNWSQNEQSKEKIFEMLMEEQPDVLCFQEFYSQPGGNWDNIAACKSDLNLEHYFFTRELTLGEGRQWGITTFTKFPIINHGELMQIPKPNTRGLRPYKGIFTDLAIGEDTIRVINIHLASIYLGREDYNTLENLTGQQDISLKRSRSIAFKLMKAYKKRGQQVRQLRNYLENEDQPYKLIICGDLNDVPTSYAYNNLSRNMQDAWTSSNWGPGATYNGPIPGLRIDQILVDKELSVSETEVINSDISDHAPLMTTIGLD